MPVTSTNKALAEITDEGLFEQLAMAVLRRANPVYSAFGHPGVNAEGKTVKSPTDGICFEKGANPPHMIIAHHTTTSHDKLVNKWLNDPSTVKKIKGSKPTAPAGDLIKTSKIVVEERKRTPSLKATLVLTTNQEPDQSLIREVEAEARKFSMEVDIWSRSRLSDFLDNDPCGQWLRYSHLGIDQELLSIELFHELSRKSLCASISTSDSCYWVERSIDKLLDAQTEYENQVTFVVAGSGMGKSVVCLRKLKAHVEAGGLGLVIPHHIVATSMSIEQAVETTLQGLHPSLSLTEKPFLLFCSASAPLILVVEDVNRSGQAVSLISKIVRWGRTQETKDNKLKASWHLFCPLWPEVMAILGDEDRKIIEKSMLPVGCFSKNEGREAVLTRSRIAGIHLSLFEAEAIACKLGLDPLLIALHDLTMAADPHQTIGQYVESCLARVATESRKHAASDYRKALRYLSENMLEKCCIAPVWQEITEWFNSHGNTTELLSQLAHKGELIRFAGTSDDQCLLFRHDRVRDWLLADAVVDLDKQNSLKEDIIEEPFYAEILGAAIVFDNPKPDFLDRMAALNPLSLFHALRLIGNTEIPVRSSICQAIHKWLDETTTHDLSHQHLRWEALALLAETDSSLVPDIVNKFQEATHNINASIAKIRNAELTGGIILCLSLEPGIDAPIRDIQIEHAKFHHGDRLIEELCGLLKKPDLDEATRIGGLRLAGHLADSKLVPAVELCWNSDSNRKKVLGDYLWALAECCADDPERYLKPVCDIWASLPDKPEKDGMLSPRVDFVAYGIRFAFKRHPPIAALDYFAQRGKNDDLKWAITCMLHGIDHPKAIEFVVHELAAINKRLNGTSSFSPFAMMAKDEWRRAQEDKRPMTKASRNLLLGFWRDKNNDKYLRTAAFSLWSSTKSSEDIEPLRKVDTSDYLADKVLFARLERGDKQAIPALINKLSTKNSSYWWQCGRYVWSPDLTKALDDYFQRRRMQVTQAWFNDIEDDRITSEMVIRLPEKDAEILLLKHWDHFQYSSLFVQAAFYVATPQTINAAKKSMSECPNPSKLLEHMSMHFGILTKGRAGLTHIKQIEALSPYLNLLSSQEIYMIWDECNRRGWFALRQKMLDNYLKDPYKRHIWNPTTAENSWDEMLSSRHLSGLQYWIDDFLKTGISWDEIFGTMISWLEKRRTREALILVKTAIDQFGTREQAKKLKGFTGIADDAHLLIADTEYAVCRRSNR